MSAENSGEVQGLQLPETESARWQPVRGGLLNIYRYDYQEFRYSGGRLVLRGNNGTGKSRVLALQLPFLLDGEITPQRVEPDGDAAKRMEWNLLMGGKYDDRLGYTWLEFGRRDENGATHYQTIGCGMRAVQGRGIAQQWFFITSARIGRDLFLQNEQGQPLTKNKLEVVLGDRVRVFGTGRVEDDRRDYRRAVDGALFQLGDRYDTLLNLLIQLRQPQLSRKLNEQALSDALSMALPPLPENVLGDVAEAFRSLENDRQELTDFIAARESSSTFLVEYRRYIQIATRRRADAVRTSHSGYESVQRRLREQEADAVRAKEAIARHDEDLARIAIQEEIAKAAEATLRSSPEMKSADELDAALLLANTARSDANAAELDAAEAAATAARDSERHQAAVTLEEGTATAARAAVGETAAKARDAGLAVKHDDVVARYHLPDAEEADAKLAAKALNEAIEKTNKGIAHVEMLNRVLDQERQKVATAQQVHTSAANSVEEGEASERQAVVELASASAALFAAYRTWLGHLKELAPAADEFEEEFATWSEEPRGDSPLARAIQDAHGRAIQALASRHSEIDERRKHAEADQRALEAEQAKLADGEPPLPPAPYTRADGDREERPGAPLWALCDFQPAVSTFERAGIEAALEAGGFLDAWVTPDGRVLQPGTHDTVLSVAASDAVPTGRVTLAAVLSPDPSGSPRVPASTVSAILDGIGYGEDEGSVWVDHAGRWRSGPLHGTWAKSEAEYIGQASREAARQRRLEELEILIDEAKERLLAIEREFDTVTGRRELLAREMAEAPSDGEVRQTIARIEGARALLTRQRGKLLEAEERLNECRQAMATAKEERDRNAADLGLSEWVEELEKLRNAVQLYRQALTELWSAIQAHASARFYLGQATTRLAESSQSSEARASRAADFQGKAAAAAARLQALQEAVGASVADILQRLEDARDKVRSVGKEKSAATDARGTEVTKKAIADSKIENAESDLSEKEDQRKVAIAALVGFATTGQLRVAHDAFATLDLGTHSVARLVELAREIEGHLQSVDHGESAWTRNQSGIHQHFENLQTSLRAHGHMPEGSVMDGIFVVSIQFQNRTCTIADLRDSLTIIIAERQELLDAREREILENYLIDEVAEHLHDRLHYAMNWKKEANEELESRPMATGMTLRFTWEPADDSPAPFVEARRLLLGARGTWSPADRAAVGAFLAQRIKTVRAEHDTGTWQAHLAEAFDYRKWHRFGIERRQEGVWKRLTKKTHGTGSGGEKSIALTLPQLAAAAAHYKSAGEHSPRLILLDEAFVGVDKNMRAKCLDLLRVFDLDVVMTSESEWACYPTVPAVAIYQLSAREGIDAVHVARWVWNGRKRERDDSPLPPAQPPGMSIDNSMQNGH